MDEIKQEKQKEITNLLYRQINFALGGETFCSIIVIVTLWKVENHIILLSWYISTLLVCVMGRYILYLCYQNVSDKITDYKKWIIYFGIGAFISGISWGFVGNYLMPADQALQTILVFLLIGVTAAASPFYSPYKLIYAGFLIPAFLPFAIWLFMQGGTYIFLGIAAIIYIVVMLATSFYTNMLITKSLNLRFDNTDLEKSVSLLRLTMESTGDGIIVVDLKNRIVDFNKQFVSMWNVSQMALESGDFQIILIHSASQLEDPEAFLQMMKLPDDYPAKELNDECCFKNGKIYEVYSQPHWISNVPVGRAWCFRDVTERRNLEKLLLRQST